MAIHIVFLMLGCALADIPAPIHRVSFADVDTMGVVEDVENIPFQINEGGTLNITTGPRDGLNGVYFDGNTYFTAPDEDLPLTCGTDIDMCDEQNNGSGITVTFWAKPDVPFRGSHGPEWLLDLGHGTNEEFGLKFGGTRAKWVFFKRGRKYWKRVTCKAPLDVNARKNENGEPIWVFISVKKRKYPAAELFMTVNKQAFRQKNVVNNNVEGKLCNATKLNSQPEEPPKTSKDIIIGGAYDHENEEVIGKFRGALADIRIYAKTLNITEIRSIMDEGRKGPKLT